MKTHLYLALFQKLHPSDSCTHCQGNDIILCDSLQGTFCFNIFNVWYFLCRSDGDVSVLVVGLGGGGLAQFIRDFVPGVRVEVVELDPAVLELAKTWFCFQTDDRLKVKLGDGLEHISTLETEGNKFICT